MTQERIDKLQELLDKRKSLQEEIKKIEDVLEFDSVDLRIDVGISRTNNSHICSFYTMPPAVYAGFAKALRLLTAELSGIQKEIDKF